MKWSVVTASRLSRQTVTLLKTMPWNPSKASSSTLCQVWNKSTLAVIAAYIESSTVSSSLILEGNCQDVYKVKSKQTVHFVSMFHFNTSNQTVFKETHFKMEHTQLYGWLKHNYSTYEGAAKESMLCSPSPAGQLKEQYVCWHPVAGQCWKIPWEV